MANKMQTLESELFTLTHALAMIDAPKGWVSGQSEYDVHHDGTVIAHCATGAIGAAAGQRSQKRPLQRLASLLPGYNPEEQEKDYQDAIVQFNDGLAAAPDDGGKAMRAPRELRRMFERAIADVQAEIRAAKAKQGVPLDVPVEAVEPEREPVHA